MAYPKKNVGFQRRFSWDRLRDGKLLTICVEQILRRRYSLAAASDGYVHSRKHNVLVSLDLRIKEVEN
jgi:hypothetical protein